MNLTVVEKMLISIVRQYRLSSQEMVKLHQALLKNDEAELNVLIRRFGGESS